MLLRSKLLYSFIVMLLLTCLVAYSGWSGISEMNRLSHLITSFEDGSTKVQEARYQQVRYILYSEQAQVDRFLDALNIGKEILNESITSMKDLQRIASTNKLIDELATFEINFEAYVQANMRMKEADTKLKVNGGTTAESLQAITASLTKFILSEQNEHTAKAYVTVVELNDFLYRTRLLTLNYNLTSKQEVAESTFAMMKEVEVAFTKLNSLLIISENIELAKVFATSFKEYQTAFSDMVEASKQRAEILVKIVTHTTPTIELANSLADAVGNDIYEVKESVDIQVILAVILAIFLGLVLAIFLTRNVIAQLGRDPGILKKMAEKVCANDYNIDDGGKKVGVYSSILEMVVSLQHNIELANNESAKALEETAKATEAIKVAELAKLEAEHAKQKGMLEAALQLEDIVTILSSASTQLAAQVEQSDRGALVAATRLGETATAMEEMNSTVIEVARNASIASEVSSNTRKKADQGATVVLDAIHSIEQVQNDSLRLKEDMQALSTQAQAINQIMGVISDIADQTNLLALNAAIEAARAGDAGRGFAVVADEVRKLAEKTMSSTSDVGNAIASIQKSANKSMAQVDATVVNIEKATKLSALSGEALHEIVGLADASADQVRVIATASEQQSATSEEISRSLAEVNVVATQSSAAMREAGLAVNELVQQANSLSRLITEMKNNK